MTDLALAAIGVRTQEKTGSPRTLSVEIEAAKDMNAGENGEGLPAVVKIYKLRSINAFMAAPYAYFSSLDKEKQAFGGDVTEAKELILLPGKTLEINEKVPRDVPYLGIVALFRTPAANRWRLTFPTEASGVGVIKIGAHTCALTATTLAPAGMTLKESSLLSASRCR